MNKKILFVDSDTAVLKNLISQLQPEEHGWTLSFCSTASDALERCESDPQDVVVSANQLSDQSGMELFNLLKKAVPQTVRILLIDEHEAQQFRGCISYAQQMMIKPINIDDFTQRVNRAFSLRKVISDPAILQLIGSADSLPSLPRIFQLVTEKLNDPNASLTEVAKLISEDIVLSSKVLKLTNSALFNLHTPAKDVSHSVGLLGSRTISSLVLSESMSDTFDCGPENEAFAEELNRHSLQSGALAAKILTKWKAKRPIIEQAIFCGIVHDIGKLVLAKYAAEQWTEVSARINERIRPDVQIERQILGISHCEVAAYLLALWGFPDEQLAVVAFHHEPSRYPDNKSQLLCAMHIATNCCPTTLYGEEFDWDYLEEWHITEKHINKFKAMAAKQ